MLLVLFFRGFPGALPILLLTLALAVYLTVIELREMDPRPHWKWWGWWISLTFLIHFVGYLALRLYVAFRRRNRARV